MISVALLAAIVGFVLAVGLAGTCGYLGIRGLIRWHRGAQDNGTWLGPIAALAGVGIVTELMSAAGLL